MQLSGLSRYMTLSLEMHIYSHCNGKLQLNKVMFLKTYVKYNPLKAYRLATCRVNVLMAGGQTHASHKRHADPIQKSNSRSVYGKLNISLFCPSKVRRNLRLSCCNVIHRQRKQVPAYLKLYELILERFQPDRGG